MEDIEEAIKRIKYFESIYDDIFEKVKLLEKSLDEYNKIIFRLEELENYYTSDKYMNDYSLDEKRLIPKEIKRGILSEDSIYDLLTENKDLRERLKNIK